MDPVLKSDRIDLLFTRDRSGTDLDPFRTGSRTVPCEHLDRFQTVPCKQKLIQSGSVQNGSGPVHVNIA